MRSPSAAFEYMLYQALLGAWPVDPHDDTFAERMQAYAMKAAREGKQETSWLNPNQAYEAGLRTFLSRILDRSIAAEFLNSMDTLARRISLSPPAVHARIKRLEELGYVRQYAAILDREKVGYDMLCLINVTLEMHHMQNINLFRHGKGVDFWKHPAHLEG